MERKKVEMDLTEYALFVRETVLELDGIMKVSARDRVKDIVKGAMGRSVRAKDPMFWPAGMLMLGLVEARRVLLDGVLTGNGAPGGSSENVPGLISEIDVVIMRHVTLWKEGYGSRIDYIDDALAGAALLKLYEQDSSGAGDPGNTKAGIAEDMKRACCFAADRIYEYLVKAPKDPEGTIVYNPGRNTNVFSDGVGQTSMFLSLYGRLFDNAKAIELAGTQLRNYMKYGCDDRSGLIYHGYSLERNSSTEMSGDAEGGKYKAVRKGLLSWGRAAGWLIMGLSEYAGAAALLSQRGEFPGKEDAGVIQWYRKLSSCLWTYQKKDGCFGWQVQAVEGPVDTSATGMIVYGLIGKVLEDEDASSDTEESIASRAERAAGGMMSNISGGKVQMALSSCDDFGVHYQVYGHYPWGQGAVLAAISKCMYS